MRVLRDDAARILLQDVERTVADHGHQIAVFLAFDRPERVRDRPGLARTYFAQRCVSDQQLARMTDAFRSIGAYVELFEGEQPLMDALASGRLQGVQRRWKAIYNGIEGSIGSDGFLPGRKALIPAVADSYGIDCCNSNAYACAIGRHKFHYFTVLRALGLRVPATWHYGLPRGWADRRQPPPGTKVIVKSTYESWSVGVTDASVFTVDGTCTDRVATIAREIDQAVTVQEFIPGEEVCITVFACPEHVVTPPVEAVIGRAPEDPEAVNTVDDNLHPDGVVRVLYEGPQELIDSLICDAVAAFNCLQLDSFGRIDFRVDRNGVGWLTDIGVSPGLTLKGSAFSSVKQLGFDYAQFIRMVVGATLRAKHPANFRVGTVRQEA